MPWTQEEINSDGTYTRYGVNRDILYEHQLSLGDEPHLLLIDDEFHLLIQPEVLTPFTRQAVNND